MAEERTEKSKFPSNYGGGWITPAQYITERLCVLIARKEKKELGDKFWLNPPWDKIYRGQIAAANQLLRDYSQEAVLAAMRDKRCCKLKSFRARWFIDPIIKEKEKEINVRKKIRKQKDDEDMKKISTEDLPIRRKENRESLFKKLKDVGG